MATRLWESNTKCLNEGENQRDERSESTVMELAPISMDGSDSNQMKLTDVIDDCLERIFKYLSVEDLLAIADTNTQLRPAAYEAYLRKFNGRCRKVYVHIFKSFDPVPALLLKHISGYNDNIFVTNLKCTLRLMRCFGHLITDLVIDNRKHDRLLMDYSNEYCSSSLIKYTLNGPYVIDLNVPFTKVEKVEFRSCKFNQEIQLHKMFPAMRSLKVFDALNAILNAEHFPHLERLVIGQGTGHGNMEATDILRLNPQLKRLKLFNHKPLRLWRNYDVFHFNNLKQLSIDSEFLINIPFQFNQFKFRVQIP